MGKTVLITGTSTGIGRATAFYFQKKGWNVIATMRSPEKEQELNKLTNVLCLRLDVTDIETVKSAIKEAIGKFGAIDAIVNNAGYGLSGAFEGTTRPQVEKQFSTNVFGLMDVIREILPHFREKREGTIINVSSMGGRITFPLYSVYHSSKWAVEGFSESLQYELLPFNIKVKIVEPGAIKTDFYDRSADIAKPDSTKDYDDYVNKAMANMTANKGSSPEDVASVIYKAASDGSGKLRYTAGSDSSMLVLLRKFMPDKLFMGIIRRAIIN